MSSQSGLTLIRFFNPIHHQLKPYKFLRGIHALWTRHLFRKQLECGEFDLVINFNYDFGFTRSLFSTAKFFTIINDDFEAQAKRWMRVAIRSQLRDTCGVSDKVLAVSPPLVEKIRLFTSNIELFMPWPDGPYVPPAGCAKNVVLYFGFINHRLNYSVFDKFLRAGQRLRVVGPIQGKAAAREIARLEAHDKFEYLSARLIEDVSLGDVYCSIIPYDLNVESVTAISLGNRAFQLLRRGIPIIYPNLPFVESGVGSPIHKASDSRAFLEIADSCRRNFETLQTDIISFLEPHSKESRYRQLLGSSTTRS